MRGEKVLRCAGFQVELVPTPRDLSANCGTALRFCYDQRDEAVQMLAGSRVRIEAVYPYVPELDVQTLDIGAIEDGASRSLKERLRLRLLGVLGGSLQRKRE